MATKTNRIPWEKISRYEANLISKIANRGIALASKVGGPDLDKVEVDMDLTAAHLSCPLQLDELLRAKDSDFGHDFFGIRRHINRRTGELEGCFLPRYAMPQNHGYGAGECA